MKKYHKDYSRQQEITEEGVAQYRYTGDYYVLMLEEREKNNIFTCHLLFTLAHTALLILAGLLNNEGSRNIFIAVPYAFVYLPTVYLLMSAFSFRFIGGEMQRVVYDKAFGRCARCLNAILVIVIYLSAACTAYAFKLQGDSRRMELVFLLVVIMIISITLFHKKYLNKWKIKVMIGRKEAEIL